MTETIAGDDVYPGAQSQRLSCRVDGPTLAVAGEVDHDTAQTVARALFYADITGDFEVDLSAVTFADSALLHLLIDTQRSLRRDGHTLRILRPSATVSRLIETSGSRGDIAPLCAPYDEVSASFGTAMS